MNRYTGCSVSVNNQTIRADGCSVNAQNCTIYGNGNSITGNNNMVRGDGNSVSGANNTVSGNGNSVKGANSAVSGSANTVANNSNFFGNFGLSNINGVSNSFNSSSNYNGFTFSSPVVNYIGASKEKKPKDPWFKIKPEADEILKENESERLACILCFERAKNCTLRPCGHMSFCSTCILDQKPATCPVCRQAVKKAKTVYL